MRLTVLFVLTSAAFAQSGATITGKVSDVFSEAISGASIQVKNAATGEEYKATTTGAGEYILDKLPPGTYELSATMITMKRYVRQDIAVQAEKILRLDITLEDGGQLGTVGDGDRFTAALRQNKPAPPSGPTPRMQDGKPDLSGFWSPAQRGPSGQPRKPEALVWAEGVAKERIQNNRRDSPQAQCLPAGVTTSAGLGGKFVQTPTLLVMLYDNAINTRQVFLDGHAHPKDLEPTWLGHSIGHWAGDTLVVDSIGFNDKTWLDFDTAYPHTEMLHVVERYRRPDLGHLELEMTIEDPGALQKPWTVMRVSNLDPKDEIMEHICTENNKYAEHLVVK
jgi:Carboxypeptidase regulatory-like domain